MLVRVQHSAAMATSGPPRAAAEVGIPEGSDGEGSAAVPVGVGVGEPNGPEWFQPVIRLLAETQYELATRSTAQPHKPRGALASLKLEEFRGGRETTTHQYRAWKKSTVIIQKLYALTDAELPLVIYTQVKGRAKQLLEILEVSDLEKPGGLEMVWKVLDRAHEKMEHERAADTYGA